MTGFLLLASRMLTTKVAVAERGVGVPLSAAIICVKYRIIFKITIHYENLWKLEIQTSKI